MDDGLAFLFMRNIMSDEAHSLSYPSIKVTFVRTDHMLGMVRSQGIGDW